MKGLPAGAVAKHHCGPLMMLWRGSVVFEVHGGFFRQLALLPNAPRIP